MCSSSTGNIRFSLLTVSWMSLVSRQDSNRVWWSDGQNRYLKKSQHFFSCDARKDWPPRQQYPVPKAWVHQGFLCLIEFCFLCPCPRVKVGFPIHISPKSLKGCRGRQINEMLILIVVERLLGTRYWAWFTVGNMRLAYSKLCLRKLTVSQTIHDCVSFL